MREELVKILQEKYPTIFLQNLYFECEDGWFSIIQDLCEEILKVDISCRFKSSGAKEKFGGLRFYLENQDYETECEYSNQIQKILMKYEKQSFSICEFCGNETDCKNIKYYMKNFCSTCKNKNNL